MNNIEAKEKVPTLFKDRTADLSKLYPLIFSAWTKSGMDVDFDIFIKGFISLCEDYDRKRNYNAWETVRKGGRGQEALGVADISDGICTGGEGYLVGVAKDPEEKLKILAGAGRNMLDSITRRYKWEPIKIRQIEQTAKGIKYYPFALYELNDAFGAELGKLRALILQKDHSARFDNEMFKVRTYQLLLGCPQTEYKIEPAYDSCNMSYFYHAANKVPPSNKVISVNDLSPSELQGLKFFGDVGRMGLPPVRTILRMRVE